MAPLHLGIIGGGAAGFAVAARAREHFGEDVKITMIEARNRLGGRLLTTDTRGEVVSKGLTRSEAVLDFGAQWAHNYLDTDGEISVKEIVEATDMTVSVAESWDMKEGSLILWKTRFPEVTEKEVREMDAWCEGSLAATILKWELICKKEGFDFPNSNALEVLDYALRQERIQEWLDENKDKNIKFPSESAITLAREHQRNMFSNYFGIEAHVTSYESLDEDESGHEHRVVTNGYYQVIEYLKKKAEGSLEILLEREVVRVVQPDDPEEGGRVKVFWKTPSHDSSSDKDSFIQSDTDSDREEHDESFDRVVVTVPLGVLKAEKIHFSPALPVPIQRSIDRLGCGLLHKTFLLWKEEHWPAVSLPGTRIIYPTSHEETFSFCLNLAEERYHGPGLWGYCAYACYPWAAEAEAMSKEDLTTHFMTMLKEALSEKKEGAGEDEELPAPETVLVSSWLKDPYALCGYSAQLVGSELTDFDAFSSTAYGAVYFAGEHCQSEMYGCVQAALCSGYKAADAIKRSLEV